MPAKGLTRHIRVFIGSPSDVPDERQALLEICHRLQYGPSLRGKAYIEPVSWDGPFGSVPMLPQVDPQAAVLRGLPKPSECDIAIFVLWSRYGTPLPSLYRKPDGSPFLSGTEWEYEDALAASLADGRPDILIYRKNEIPVMPINFSTKEMRARQQQYELVQQFFADLTATQRGYNTYDTLNEFVEMVAMHVEQLLVHHLKTPKTPADLAWEYLESGTAHGSPKALLEYLSDRRQEPHLRKEVLRRLNDDVGVVVEPRVLASTLVPLLGERSPVAETATRVFAALAKRGTADSKHLMASAENGSWEVRSQAIYAAIELDDGNSLEILVAAAGTLSYWLPVQRAVGFVVEKCRKGDRDYQASRNSLIEAFLSHPKLSNPTRDKLQRALSDQWPDP